MDLKFATIKNMYFGTEQNWFEMLGALTTDSLFRMDNITIESMIGQLKISLL